MSLSLTLLLLVLFLRGVQARELLQALLRANYLFVLPGVVLYLAGVWLRAVRWRYLLAPLGSFRTHRLFPPIVMGFAINNLLPGKLGLVARAYFLGQREGVNKVASAATVVLDNIFDTLALLFLLIALALFFPLEGWLRHVVLLIMALYGGFLILFFSLAASPRRVRRLARPLLRSPWGEKLEGWLESSFQGMASLRQPTSLIRIFTFSLLVWLLEAAVFYLLALAFQLNLPFATFLLAAAIANLALVIPSLPGGIGPFEYFGKQTLVLFGAREALATAYMGVLHLVILFPVTLLGLAFLGFQRQTLARVRAEVKKGEA